MIAVLFAAVASNSQARSTHSAVVVQAKQKFYHARGVVRWIGHHSAVTQYNPNPRKKHHWQAAVKFWAGVRDDAWAKLHPAPLWPRHHQLWLCISSTEGSPTSINPNGHYGMLQMHADWGYGTSHHASDDSQLVQEQAAERAYASAHYASSFLRDQWFKWDGRYDCMTYA